MKYLLTIDSTNNEWLLCYRDFYIIEDKEVVSQLIEPFYNEENNIFLTDAEDLWIHNFSIQEIDNIEIHILQKFKISEAGINIIELMKKYADANSSEFDVSLFLKLNS